MGAMQVIRKNQDKYDKSKTIFRRACFEFLTTLSFIAISAFVAGYVAGSLGAPRDAAISGGAGAMMAALWIQKRRKARKSQRPA
jgi:hypothetical protein